MHYDAAGKLKNIFGGRGEGKENLDNAHGIVIDKRKTPLLYLLLTEPAIVLNVFRLMENCSK